MGWKYLDANLEEEKATELIQERIERMAEGGLVHQADGLRFGLYNALRQRGMENYPYAQLRCSHKDCVTHDRLVSCTNLGDNIHCTGHKDARGRSLGDAAGSGVLECTECGHLRTDRFTWCEGCRRMFR